MSKKDLLERLSRSPNETRPRRTGAETPRPRVSGEEVATTRVNRRVVRRRAAPEPEPPPVVRRRAPAAVEPTAVRAADDAGPGDAAEAARPAEAEVEASAERVEQVNVAAVDAVPVVEVAPTEPAAEPSKPEAVTEAAPAAAPAAPEPVPESAAAAEPVAAAPEAAPPQSEDEVPDSPRFSGLGIAVVAPPPGYDPTNPQAWRRRVAAESDAKRPASTDASAPRGRRRVEQPAAPAAPAARPDRARRGRRRTGAPAMQRTMPGRRKVSRGKKGPVVSSTVAPKAHKMKVRIDNAVSVGQLAHEMGLKAAVVIRKLMELDQMVTMNEMLDIETATVVASEFGYEVENVGFQEDKILQHIPVDEDEANLEPRPPVVTIMGHVDHGKTTLLDAIRESRVASGEAGGITQHIGAYQVDWNDQAITFLDTPGHAAFTAMRARGASVTDIVILVVAADDGVQEQTKEAISHARAAEVPIIVAINKMDKPGVTSDPIKQKLSEQGLLAEDWGGDTICVPVSALKRQGLEELLEAVLIQAEVLELSANATRPAEGSVIEAKVERGRGPVATVLVQRGTLRHGDNVVLGCAHGKVRAMHDFRGKRLKQAGPSTPVEVFGISELPEVGDTLSVVKTDKDARTLADHRAETRRQAAFGGGGRRTAEDLYAAARASQAETLHIVLKADVQGSLEALRNALLGLEVGGAELRILHAGVGNVSESDVNLVAVNGGMLIGFNVKVDPNARKAADQQGVNPEIYEVIYDVLDKVEARMSGMLEPELEEVHKGTVEVRAVFHISRIGTIAGCYVQDGTVARSHFARVMRNGEAVWEGKIGSLKRFKDDVREVGKDYECGVGLQGFNDVKEGDILDIYAMEEVARA